MYWACCQEAFAVIVRMGSGMGRIYLLYYDYRHTSGNHAGMAYLARALRASNRSIRLFKHPAQEYRGGWVFALVYAVCLAIYLKVVLRRDDQVVFFEYLSGDFGYQDTLARLLRKWGCQNTFSGIVHLGGQQLLDLYKNPSGIRKRLDALDRVLVFGSSLKVFLSDSIGYGKPVILTYHYADTDFYKPSTEPRDRGRRVQVLFLGRLKRDVDQLLDIIKRTRGIVDYHICGDIKWHARFKGLPNVSVYPPLSEEDLRSLMQVCDVNLSVFYDTVGSNAITSTLASGLVQVASHVGSIEDYGDPLNSFWCKNTGDFVVALSMLSRDRERLGKMKEQARKKAESISLDSFVIYFNRLFSEGSDGVYES